MKTVIDDIRESRAAVLYKELSSWKDFVEYMSWTNRDEEGQRNTLPRMEEYVWRGHRSSCWRLDSAFDRTNSSPRREVALGEHRRCFAYAVRGRLGEFGLSIRELKELIGSKVLSENHLWALGQHYGLATPLLDWSTSPFVAAYFAFEEPSRLEDVDWESTGNDLGNDWNTIKGKLQDKGKRDKLRYHPRTVFGLNCKQVREHTTSLEPFSPLSSEHPRLISQRGLFTLARDGLDIEETVSKNWHKECQHPWLVRIHIPNDQREDFLRGLNLMNINRVSLFPDIDGAARFCNLGLDLRDYSTPPGAV